MNIKNHKHRDNITEYDKLNTFVGTKQYVPPEILNGVGSSPFADMWSLGVLIYQLFTGKTPFLVMDSEYFTFQNIIECNYEIPDLIPKEGKDLIQKLLVLDPDERLTAIQVKSHSFFDGFDFDKVYESNSPLNLLYKQIKENEVNLDTSEEDSFVEEENFDEEFNDWQNLKSEIECKLIRDERKDKSNIIYLKKSSSLGEKDIKELNYDDEFKVDRRNADEIYDGKARNKTRISDDTSKENLSNDNTYDSALSPTLQDKKYLGSNIPDNKSDDHKMVQKKVIVCEGFIKKITAWIIYKRRYMELSYVNDVPKLVYYTAENKAKLRNEIPLNKLTRVYITGPSKFEISNPDETYFFKDCGGDIKIKSWVASITKAIASLSLRKASIKGNKILSASFC